MPGENNHGGGKDDSKRDWQNFVILDDRQNTQLQESQRAASKIKLSLEWTFTGPKAQRLSLKWSVHVRKDRKDRYPTKEQPSRHDRSQDTQAATSWECWGKTPSHFEFCWLLFKSKGKTMHNKRRGHAQKFAEHAIQCLYIKRKDITQSNNEISKQKPLWMWEDWSGD